MPTYEVIKVAPESRPWKAQGKYDMLEYRVDLRGPNARGETVDVQNVEWSRKAESKPPTVGQTLDVEKFENGPKGLKLRLVQQMGGGGFSKNGSKDFKADPVKNIATATEASHKVAVDIIRLAIETKQDPADLARLTVDTARVLLDQIKAEMESAK